MQRSFALQDLSNSHGFVDGSAHGFQNNGAIEIVLFGTTTLEHELLSIMQLLIKHVKRNLQTTT
jgi:hypothetical protein